MGKKPTWMVRWGITTICAICAFICIGAGVISYNDVISSKVVITTQIPPTYLKAKTSGSLDKIFIELNDTVQKNQTLAVLKNLADYEDVITIKKRLSDKKKITSLQVLDSLFPINVQLGEIQNQYLNFIRSYQKFILKNEIDGAEIEKYSLEERVKEKQQNLSQQKKQLSLNKIQLRLSRKKYARSKTLFKKGVLSAAEFEDIKKQYFSDEQSHTQLKAQVSSSEYELKQQNNQMSSTILEQVKTDRESYFALQESLQNLNTAIKNWEERYVIFSPIDGTITIFDIWNEYQNVETGQILFTVIPLDRSKIIGRIKVPIRNSSKIKIGQKAILKIDNYPFQEWGNLSANVVHIAEIPEKGEKPTYTVLVSVDSLVTSYQRTLSFKQEMQGSAEIITEELSILERIFYQLKSLNL
ncbi:HlyD family secretion protein [Aquimarina sp. M1]